MPTLIDGHAHLHGCHEPRTALDAAAETFPVVAAGLGIEPASVRGCLILVDPMGVDGFGRLTAGGIPGWEVRPTTGECLVALRESDGARLLVIGGRQIRTESGLEVLAYGSRHRFEDGGALSDHIEEVLDADAVPVIPWGFGKWLGRRGTIVESVLRSSLSRYVLVADSFTRPRMARPPAPFRTARELGIPVVAGTDPLPFPGQEGRVGKYGFVADTELGLDDPAGVLRGYLTRRGSAFRRYGRRERTLRALWDQVAMQTRKRTTRRAPDPGRRPEGDDP